MAFLTGLLVFALRISIDGDFEFNVQNKRFLKCRILVASHSHLQYIVYPVLLQCFRKTLPYGHEENPQFLSVRSPGGAERTILGGACIYE